MNTMLCESDVASLLRIAGEVNELEQDQQLRREHILNGLLSLVGGCFAVCSEVDPDPANVNGWAYPDSASFGGNAAAEMRSAAANYVAGRSDALDPCTPRLMRRENPIATVRREDVIDRSWFRSEHFNTLRRPWGIGESLYGKLRTPDARCLKMTLHRELNDQPFTERDARLLQLFNQNLAGLYVTKASAEGNENRADPRVESLAPRLRPVLERFLAGDSEKQAAAKLSLSRHTVHQYSKVLYRTFGVNSRSELMARFVTSPQVF